VVSVSIAVRRRLISGRSVAKPDAGRLTTRDAPSDASKGPSERPHGAGRLARASARDAVRDLGPRELAVALLSVAAALALFASYFATVVYVTVGSASCQDRAEQRAADCVKSGGDEHSIAFIQLALALVAMAVAAAAGGSRLAGLAIAAIGVVALVTALASDLPQTHRAGALASDFSAARAHPGAGLWLEIVGGAVALVAGVLALTGGRRLDR
jgi:hypothetical protein